MSSITDAICFAVVAISVVFSPKAETRRLNTASCMKVFPCITEYYDKQVVINLIV